MRRKEVTHPGLEDLSSCRLVIDEDDNGKFMIYQ